MLVVVEGAGWGFALLGVMVDLDGFFDGGGGGNMVV